MAASKPIWSIADQGRRKRGGWGGCGRPTIFDQPRLRQNDFYRRSKKVVLAHVLAKRPN